MDITKEKPNRTLLVLKYLWDNSDIDHPATIKDIAAYLEGFGYNATRKTISKDIDELIEIGIDIDCKREEHNLYFLDVRVFELAEVKLLVDAVQSSRFIPTKKSKALIEKLSTFVGPHQSSILKRQLYVDKRIKASNEGIFYLVDNIHTAIREKKRITFQYQEYNQNKEKVLKHQGQVYSLSPYALVWNDDCYYVLGYSDSHEKVVKFRVDRMNDMRISEMTAVRKPKDFDVSDYFSQIFSMYDGDDCHVTLLCENELMKHIIDRFGEKVFTAPADDKHFVVETTVSLSQTFYGGGILFRREDENYCPTTSHRWLCEDTGEIQIRKMSRGGFKRTHLSFHLLTETSTMNIMIMQRALQRAKRGNEYAFKKC